MGKVATISSQMAVRLQDELLFERNYFAPIEDKNGDWVISEEEIAQCDISTHGELKALQNSLRNHQKKDAPQEGKEK